MKWGNNKFRLALRLPKGNTVQIAGPLEQMTAKTEDPGYLDYSKPIGSYNPTTEYGMEAYIDPKNLVDLVGQLIAAMTPEEKSMLLKSLPNAVYAAKLEEASGFYQKPYPITTMTVNNPYSTAPQYYSYSGQSDYQTWVGKYASGPAVAKISIDPF